MDRERLRAELEAKLGTFIENGKLKVWPSKQRARMPALCWCALAFEPERRYTEREVNEMLQGIHSFEDLFILRRSLVEYGFVGRERNGSAYWLITTVPEAARPFLD